MMNAIPYQQAVQVLRRAGFGKAEIDRLYQLRRAYQTSELDQLPLDPRRLEFVRWLITTGRLTDQLPEAGQASFDAPLRNKEYFRDIFARFPVFSLSRKKSRHL